MNLASLDGSYDDDYFLTLKNYLEPLVVYAETDKEYSNVVAKFKTEYTSITKQIRTIEETIQKFEKDLLVLSNAGEQLLSSEMKEQLKRTCEDYIATHQLDDIKRNMENLYTRQKAMLKALSPILHGGFDNIDTMCTICFERHVYVFNQNCGHTLCVQCSHQTKKCPMCRALTNYKPLVYSA